MTRSDVAPVYEFGPFRLDPSERLLLRDGQPIALKPKAFDLLVFLVERQGRLVPKHELMEGLWPGTFVEEANLTYTVSILRKALGDQEGDQFVQTVPTRGYRFVASVHRENGTDSRSPEGHCQQGALLPECSWRRPWRYCWSWWPPVSAGVLGPPGHPIPQNTS